MDEGEEQKKSYVLYVERPLSDPAVPASSYNDWIYISLFFAHALLTGLGLRNIQCLQ